MKTRHILFLLLAVLTAATSCVYDYNPQIEGEGGYLIVEGNIVIGDMCNVRLDYSWSLVDTAQGDERWRILASSKMHIEDNQGGRYENLFINYGGTYIVYPAGLFDLTDADPSREYRLVIENEKGTYVSPWQKSLDAGEIDDLSYKISDDGTSMSILISAHSDDPAGSYYRNTTPMSMPFIRSSRIPAKTGRSSSSMKKTGPIAAGRRRSALRS